MVSEEECSGGRGLNRSEAVSRGRTARSRSLTEPPTPRPLVWGYALFPSHVSLLAGLLLSSSIIPDSSSPGCCQRLQHDSCLRPRPARDLLHSELRSSSPPAST
ncbi:hypothetical protein BDW75DRAFT_169171 [Aspergillus navahoensis]